MEGLKLALRDYRLYVFVLFQHTSLLSQTFQYFFPTIVNTLGKPLGLTRIEILWITAPVWVSTISPRGQTSDSETLELT